jgi:hypothetical protein
LERAVSLRRHRQAVQAGLDNVIPCHVDDDGKVDAYILYLTDEKIRAAEPPLDQVKASHEDLA